MRYELVADPSRHISPRYIPEISSVGASDSKHAEGSRTGLVQTATRNRCDHIEMLNPKDRMVLHLCEVGLASESKDRLSRLQEPTYTR